ncbi:MAG TPA: hypothetical protein VE130_05065, partial [Nitrososphaeraceae archaeon]|nr:hypothetical protein [Nitrososphaeraceae archaeon]
MELEGKHGSSRNRSVPSMIAAPVLAMLIVLSTLTIGTATPAAAQQDGFLGASTNAACGQVVSGQVNLTANLNCSGDGIIVGGPNTVINMNGFSITGPGQDSSKVGIMVPNVDNVEVNGPGSIGNFQAGALLTGANGFTINSVIL